MTDPVRVGLIGTSWWAEGMFLPSLLSHDGARVVALCGRDRARAGELARAHGIPRVATDYREMIRAGGLDALVVAAPDDLHHAMVLAGLDAGLAVLCEKPLARTAAEALEMYRRARAAGVVTLVLFTYRWLPFFRFARDQVASGALGTLRRAEFRYLSNGALAPDYSWRYDPARANGVLGDLGSHVIDLARWFLGEIESVSAELAATLPRRDPAGRPATGANDQALLRVTFAGGVPGVIETSGVTPLGDRTMKQWITIEGDRGTLEVQVPYRGAAAEPRLRIVEPGGASRSLEVPGSYQTAAEAENPFLVFRTRSAGARLFIDGIRSGQCVTPDFHDGWRVQEVIGAALESARCGGAVVPCARDVADV